MKYTIQIDDDGRRLDRVLRKILKDTKLCTIYKSLRKKQILLNNKKATPDLLVQNGDVIDITFLSDISKSRNKTNLLENNFPFEILFEDDNFLVINKPYGVATQGGTLSSENIANIIKQLFPSTSSFQAAPLHRLDKNTSGILVISKSLVGAKTFSDALQNHLIKKTYVGVARGVLNKNYVWQDILDGSLAITAASPIRFYKDVNFLFNDCYNNKDRITNQKIDNIKGGNQKIILKSASARIGNNTYNDNNKVNIKGKERTDIFTLVEYVITTGRKHQIRRQSAMHGYALFGDSRYGGGSAAGVREYFLHATRLNVHSDNKILKVLDGIECVPPFLE